MATLVLTVVGGFIAGPLGSALGSLAGQAIDREIFKPKGREGPRLAELAVQTSTYGAAIPKLFGTMRVAGQVVWATDLIESRSTQGGGKGQPSTTSYSYAASFAVLLSARPIRAVRRIWADGKLLRGSAGDFKTRTGFRVHPGGEDQAADPLIASAEGVGQTPALRGCAYAVFEMLALADFGNRIPSLTFEVEADAGAVPLGAIIEGVSGGAVRSDLARPIGGFSGYGDSVRGAIGGLAEVAGARFVEREGALWATAGSDAGAIVSDGAAADGKREGALERSIGGLDAVPRRATIAHYDAARDYQVGTQAAAREGAGRREARIELAAAVSAQDAKGLAEDVLARAIAGRVTRTVRVPWSPDMPEVGSTVRVAGDPARWRVTGWTLERMVAELALVRVGAGSAVALAASSGTVLREVDAVAGATRLEVFELPPLDEAALARPRLWIAACGDGAGWRGAELLVRFSGEGGWMVADPARRAAVIGTVVVPPGDAVAGLVDARSAVEVDLAHEGMLLADADDAALDAGANVALIGDELIQFARAEPLGGVRWRLSGLWRGRRGSEAEIAGHGSGERFVLIDFDALVAVDAPPYAIGGVAEVSASGIGDVAPVLANGSVTGRSVAPPAPVQPRVEVRDDGGLDIGWTRRSRIGWAWRDGVDAPLGEEREAYRLTVTRGDGAVRVVETGEAGWTYPAVELAADRAAGAITLSIVQTGTLAASEPLTILL